MDISIGICAYNEEENIGNLLDRITTKYEYEVIIVASGCTDKTVEIAKNHPTKPKVIVEQRRKGKASAVNLFLDEAIGEICILISADLLPLPTTINRLIAPIRFLPEVGMVGGKPIPINLSWGFTNKLGIALWHLHHLISINISPKCGEIIAFRNIVKKIPPNTLCDEAHIEHFIVSKGYKLYYEQTAIISNKCPTNLKDFWKQRKRIHLGHLQLQAEYGYEVSSTKGLKILFLLLQARINPLIIFSLFCIEFLAHIRALRDYDKKRVDPAWDMVKSTKDLI